MFLYFDRNICDALFDAKTKLKNADYVLGNASIGVYVKSVLILCMCSMIVIVDENEEYD
jgi:Trk-type K+ transport system membrane component